MKTLTKSFEERQGQTVRRRWQFKDETLTPINFAGYTARLHFRTTPEAEQPILSLTTENGGISFLGGGWMEIYITDEQMSALPVASYVYDLEWIAPNDDVLTPVAGKMKVKREITRA